MLCACESSVGPTKDVEVDVKKSKPTWSEVQEQIRIETLIPIVSDSVRMGSCQKACKIGEAVYILDPMQRAILKYDLAAKSLMPFIHAVGSARNEYTAIDDFCTDPKGNFCILDGNKHRIIRYDKEGKYIDHFDCENATSMAALEDGSYAINTCQTSSEDALIRYSESGEQLQKLPQTGKRLPIVLNNPGSITSDEDGLLYTTPFDFNIYRVEDNERHSIARLHFGEAAVDANRLQGMDVIEAHQFITTNMDKISMLQNLYAYEDWIFFSTDMNGQIMYNRSENTAVVLSNLELPYGILFASPLFLNTDGEFCTILSENNVKQALIPLIEGTPTGIKAIDGISTWKDTEAQAWILTGRLH